MSFSHQSLSADERDQPFLLTLHPLLNAIIIVGLAIVVPPPWPLPFSTTPTIALPPPPTPPIHFRKVSISPKYSPNSINDTKKISISRRENAAEKKAEENNEGEGRNGEILLKIMTMKKRKGKWMRKNSIIGHQLPMKSIMRRKMKGRKKKCTTQQNRRLNGRQQRLRASSHHHPPHIRKRFFPLYIRKRLRNTGREGEGE